MNPQRSPEKFGRYEVVAEIGQGAMGRVFKAFDPLVKRVVAIKTVKGEHLTQSGAQDYLRRFQREAQAAGSLSHPHILSIFDVGEDYFVMEFLEGTTLEDMLKGGVKLEPAEVIRILAPVADAVDYLHKVGIIHRDIKPANIMVQTDGRPKLMDFGVAHLESSVMTAAGEVFGSPSYMAPEQIAGGEVTPATDIFSLAVVTYQALTGQKPFQGESLTTVIYRVVHEDAPPPRRYNLELPQIYDDIFRRALAKDASRRYGSATSFMAALELKEVDSVFQALGEPPAAPQPPPAAPGAVTVMQRKEEVAVPPPPKPAAPRPSKTPLWAGFGALALAAVGTGAWLAYPRFRAQPPAAATVTGLRVETEPSGAAVLVDGQPVGASPLSVPSLNPGSHNVRVTRDGYAPAELSLEIVAGSNLAPLRFNLQPVSGELDIESVPTGAAVQIDGKDGGPTPLKSRVESGRHAVRVEHPGFKPWTQNLEVRAGDTEHLEAKLEATPSEPVRTAAAKPPKAAPSPTPEPLREGDLVALGPDVKPPVKLSGDPAPYPKAARRAKLEGSVTVDMVVTEKGEATDIRVVESAGEILDAAVIEAVRRWHFAPAEKNGVKVRVHWPSRQQFLRGS